MDIITRKEAKAKGLKRYFTGKPCKNGHLSEKCVIGYSCVMCANIARKKWDQDHPEYNKKYNQNNPEKNAIAVKKYRLNNIDRYKAGVKKSQQKNSGRKK